MILFLLPSFFLFLFLSFSLFLFFSFCLSPSALRFKVGHCSYAQKRMQNVVVGTCPVVASQYGTDWVLFIYLYSSQKIKERERESERERETEMGVSEALSNNEIHIARHRLPLKFQCEIPCRFCMIKHRCDEEEGEGAESEWEVERTEVEREERD